MRMLPGDMPCTSREIYTAVDPRILNIIVSCSCYDYSSFNYLCCFDREKDMFGLSLLTNPLPVIYLVNFTKKVEKEAKIFQDRVFMLLFHSDLLPFVGKKMKNSEVFPFPFLSFFPFLSSLSVFRKVE